MTINSLMPTINSLDCIEVNSNVNNMDLLPLPSQNSFHLIHNGCLDEGTEYEVTFRHVFDPGNVVTFEVDSVSNYISLKSVIYVHIFRLS